MGLDTTGTDQVLALNGGVFVRETIPGRSASLSDLTMAAVGVMNASAIVLFAGDVITTISVRTGGTGIGTPTNYWLALYDDSATPALMSQCADQGSTALAANTTLSKALVTPQTIKRTAVYYVAFMAAGASGCTLLGQTLLNATASTGLVTGQKQLANSSGSGLTTTAPATIASPTATFARFYAALN